MVENVSGWDSLVQTISSGFLCKCRNPKLSCAETLGYPLIYDSWFHASVFPPPGTVCLWGTFYWQHRCRTMSINSYPRKTWKPLFCETHQVQNVLMENIFHMWKLNYTHFEWFKKEEYLAKTKKNNGWLMPWLASLRLRWPSLLSWNLIPYCWSCRDDCVVCSLQV